MDTTTVPAIPTTDFTESIVDGTGVFDLMMTAVSKQLDREFVNNRIKGAEYATVYLGAMSAVMQFAVQFSLGREVARNQALNLMVENRKLEQEILMLVAQTTRTNTENTLLLQKIQTEKAQVETGIADPDSVIGKQMNLYQAQTDGYTRNAEQSAAKIMVDTWNVRRTTDEGTVADGKNGLHDQYIGATIRTLLDGVGAPYPPANIIPQS